MLYNDSLNVFEKSLCGLEIVFERMLSMIQNALAQDIKYGLSHVTSEIESIISEMQEDVEREIYFSNAQNVNIEQKQFIDSIEQCFEKEKDIHMAEECTEWLRHSGVQINEEAPGVVRVSDRWNDRIDSGISMYIHPVTDQELVGTFSREIALKNEEVEFFSPSSQLCKAIFDNIHMNQIGRVSTLHSTKANGSWSGFLTTWNVSYNFEKQYRTQKETLEEFNVKEFLPNEQILVIVKFAGTDEFNENEIYSRIRSNEESFDTMENVSDFIGCGEIFSDDTWFSFCKQKISVAKKEATLIARKWVKKKMLEDALQKKNIVRSIKERKIYMESNNGLIKWGFEHLEVQLDSVVYVEL